MIARLRRRWRLLDRPTGDILVLMIAGTICGGLLATGIGWTVFAFVHPDANLEAPARFVADITNTLIGLLAGFLAGRTGLSGDLPPNLPPKNGTTKPPP